MKVIRKDIREDEEAVSPVIGVILMVAITVILAAVITAFVFGMGPPEAAPQASLRISDTDTTAHTITIVHDGGDSLDLTDVKVIVDNGGTRSVWDPAAATGGALNMSVGDTMLITTNDMKINGVDTGVNAATAVSLGAGDMIDVMLIDKISEKKISQLSARC